MRIIGDIGGTNARFALSNEKGEISEVKAFLKKDYASVAEALKTYKATVSAEVADIALAVNTPIVNGKPHINFNNWGYENENLAQDIGVKKVAFFNDLQAHAMSLPFLKPEDKVQVSGKAANPKGVIAVAGPGTGLGLAYGIFDECQNKYNFHGSEGGNQAASAVDAEQLEIMSKMLTIMPSVRWEDLSSGRGINSLYKALYNEDRPTEDVMADFAKGSDRAENVFRLFCEFLGVFVHNVGITFLPEGGIYIIGGILTRKENIDFMINSTRFLEYYSSLKRYKTEYLDNYPIYLITHFNPALLGLANCKL